MKIVHFTAVISMLASATACSESDGRGGTNLAIDPMACEGYCGEQSPIGCFCDNDCIDHGDCCPNAGAICAFEHSCDDDGNDGGGGDPPPPGNQACFPGASGDGTTCFPVVTIDPYNYPSSSSANYREPIAYFDVEALDLEKKLTANFKFSEISVPSKGQYQVVQPHAIEKLQKVRDQAGALRVNSGFRSPPYNAQVGGATKSRHMYGDAFDVVPQSTSQNNLYNICNNLGAGYVAKYNSGHVHCDWRNDAVDPLFYGSLATGAEPPPYYRIEDLRAEVVEDAGVLSVVADGYDRTEGELLREWTAYDAEGAELVESSDLTLVPPADTALVRVTVGGLIEVEHAL